MMQTSGNPITLVPHGLCEKLVETFDRHSDRYEAHELCRPILTELAADASFMADLTRKTLSDPRYLWDSRRAKMIAFERGEIRLYANMFSSRADRLPDITIDNIHHHGYLILSTIPLFGPGYDTIVFKPDFEFDKGTLEAKLAVDREFRHAGREIQFIDAFCPHVVFHPAELTSTLALWSANKPRLAQDIKRRTGRLIKFVRPAVKAIRSLHLDKVFGLNSEADPYFQPRGKKIYQMTKYKLQDGTHEEFLYNIFFFLQQSGFSDFDFLRKISPAAPPLAQTLIAQLIAGEKLVDRGEKGFPERRVAKADILEAAGLYAQRKAERPLAATAG